MTRTIVHDMRPPIALMALVVPELPALAACRCRPC